MQLTVTNYSGRTHLALLSRAWPFFLSFSLKYEYHGLQRSPAGFTDGGSDKCCRTGPDQ